MRASSGLSRLSRRAPSTKSANCLDSKTNVMRSWLQDECNTQNNKSCFTFLIDVFTFLKLLTCFCLFYVFFICLHVLGTCLHVLILCIVHPPRGPLRENDDQYRPPQNTPKTPPTHLCTREDICLKLLGKRPLSESPIVVCCPCLAGCVSHLKFCG